MNACRVGGRWQPYIIVVTMHVGVVGPETAWGTGNCSGQFLGESPDGQKTVMEESLAVVKTTSFRSTKLASMGLMYMNKF